MSKLLTVRQVAERLSVHEMTIRRHIKQGSLPAVKVGSRVRIRESDLERHMKPATERREALLPPIAEPDEAELERRRAHFNETMSLRREIGPIDITASELIAIGRREEEAQYG